MKHFKLIALASAMAVGMSSCEQDFTGPKSTDLGSVPVESAGTPLSASRYLVLSNSTELPSGLAKKIADAGGSVESTIPQAGLVVVNATSSDFVQKAKKISGVRSVIPDIKVQFVNPAENVLFEEEDYTNPPNPADEEPFDPYYDLQWGNDAVDAPEAWNAGYFGEGARVAVLDGGFDTDHPDLVANVDLGASASFVPGEELEYALPDAFSHGTHVAGTIAAAENGFGTVGVAPKATLILVKVLGDAGSGSFASIIAGMIHAADVDADVINMSLGAYLPKNGYVDEDGVKVGANEIQELKVATQRAANYAYQHGVTIIASAGNDGMNGQADKAGMHIPSDLSHVISISATGPEAWALNPEAANFDMLASYSNYGNTIDFAAPGGDYDYPGNEIVTISGVTQYVYVLDFVFSTGSMGRYYWSVGTSMASPHAAGVAAIIVGANGGEMSPAQVEAALKKSADDIYKPGRDIYSGHGQVNAFNAVAGGI